MSFVTKLPLLAGILTVFIAACPSESSEETPAPEKQIFEEQRSAAELAPYFSALTPAAPYKTYGSHNPLITQAFGADPFTIEYDGRIYVYMTGDFLQYDENNTVVNQTMGKVQTIRIISSADLVNWTDHGAVPVAGPDGIASWADTSSWAPAAAWRTVNGKPRFFLYFANNANGIGVLTADSPTGPWRDPIGKPLISRDTPNCSAGEVVWCFDPAVFIDDDGQAYLYFGGGIEGKSAADPGTARVVKLNGSMISLADDPQPLSVPYLFEDSGINKIDGRYYYSYCTNWNTSGNTLGIGNAVIAWMSGSSPLGPFTFEKQIMRNPSSVFGAGSTNHHALFSFKGKWYMAYHAQMLEVAMLGAARGYRSTHIDRVTIAANGAIEPITPTREGVTQELYLDPYRRTEAETIGVMAGIDTQFHKAANDDAEHITVTGIDSGDWLALYGVDFGAGATQFRCRVTGPAEGFAAIQLRLDSPDGPAAGYVYIKLKDGEAADQYGELTVDLPQPITGVHDLAFLFYGTGFAFDSWEFL